MSNDYYIDGMKHQILMQGLGYLIQGLGPRFFLMVKKRKTSLNKASKCLERLLCA